MAWNGVQFTFGFEQVKQLFAQKTIDTCYVLRVLDLKEAHELGWHYQFKCPLLPASEKSHSGFYVLFGGIFGTGKYEPIGRHNNADTFYLPSNRAGLFSIPCQGRKGGDQPQRVPIELPGNFVLGCNPLLERRDV